MLSGFEAQLDDLRLRVEALEVGLTCQVGEIMAAGFTRSEAIVLSILLDRRVVSREVVLIALYGSKPFVDAASDRSPDVFVSKVRSKLHERGVRHGSVVTVPGLGWKIHKTQKTAIRRALGIPRGS